MTAVAGIKAALDPLYGNRVYRDEPPEIEPAFPYVTVFLDVDRSKALAGDGGTIATSETTQVDLWQQQADESDALLETTIAAIDGLRLAAPFLRVRVEQAGRLVDEDDIVHHTLTVRTVRLM